MRYLANFGQASKDAQALQSPTLERLAVKGCDGFTSSDLIQILSSSLNLGSVFDDSGNYNPMERLNAISLINRDPDTGLLIPWACETSLKELRFCMQWGDGLDQGRCTFASKSCLDWKG